MSKPIGASQTDEQANYWKQKGGIWSHDLEAFARDNGLEFPVRFDFCNCETCATV